jgi:hypothetical protein
VEVPAGLIDRSVAQALVFLAPAVVFAAGGEGEHLDPMGFAFVDAKRLFISTGTERLPRDGAGDARFLESLDFCGAGPGSPLDGPPLLYDPPAGPLGRNEQNLPAAMRSPKRQVGESGPDLGQGGYLLGES